MNFSAQQLQGGAQFGARTRVGNWQEDICLQEEKYADFRKKKETGKLAIGIRSKRFHLCLQNVPHTFSPDNKLRFGDTVMIENEALKATLVDDPFEEILPQSEKYIVTATPSEVGPTARSTFVITRIPASLEDPVPHIYENTDVLHYGQPFQLTANPSIRVDDEMGTLRPPLYLASTLKTERAASKWSNRQAVYLTERGDYQTVWKLFRPAKAKFDGVTRQFSEYEAVSANEGLTLIHKATSKPLAVDSKYGERTDFGGEWEVTAHAFVGLGKNKVIVAEQYGEATPGSITKPEQNENVWVIKTASSPEAAVDHRKLPPLVTPALVAEHVRKQLANLGHTIAAVKAKIPNNLPKIDIEDAKWIFKELEVPLSDEYLGLWLKTLDKKGNGVLLSSDLLAALQ